MKKLAIALALLASFAAAHADTVAYAANKAGGQIRLTDYGSQKCERVGKEYFVAYSLNPDSNVEPLRGCWRIVDDSYQVLWDDGAERMFPMSSFQLTSYWRKTYGPNATKTSGNGV